MTKTVNPKIIEIVQESCKRNSEAVSVTKENFQQILNSLDITHLKSVD